MFFILSILGFVGSYFVIKILMEYLKIQKPIKRMNRKQIFIIQAIVTIIIALIFTYHNYEIGVWYGILSGSILSLITSFFKTSN